jgi:hypothetical protein
MEDEALWAPYFASEAEAVARRAATARAVTAHDAIDRRAEPGPQTCDIEPAIVVAARRI